MRSPSLLAVRGLLLLVATVNSGWAWHSTVPTTRLGRGSRCGSSGLSVVSLSPWAGGLSYTNAIGRVGRCSAKKSRVNRRRSPHVPPSITVAFASKTDRETEAVDTARSGAGSEGGKNVGDDNELQVGEMYSNPVTALLGRFLPDAAENDADASSANGGMGEFTDDFDVPKAVGLSIDEMVRRLDTGLREREWFVTGNVCPELFADDFFFKDPDVQLRGIQKYAEGVRRLFDQETSRAEIISCELDPERTVSVNASSGNNDNSVRVVSVRWRLSGRVNIGPLGLNIKPYVVTSDLHVRENDGLVVYQEDTFDIPGWDLLLSSFAPWLPFLAPPAPPVSEMMSSTK